MIRVYRYGLQPPSGAAEIVREQMLAAHRYRNDLVQIERGRRWAVRRLHDTPDCREAEDSLRAATRSTRTDALRSLEVARRNAEQTAASEEMVALARWVADQPESEGYDASALDPIGTEILRLKGLEGELQRGARALTTAYWGTYLIIEDAAQKARKAPLYADDGLTPNDPHFVRWRGEGQVGVQIQSTRSMTGAQLLAGGDTRARITREGDRHWLWLRVGSEGRDPIWACWPMASMRRRKRAIPDAARIAWVRVSRRTVGTDAYWSAEITLDTCAEPTRTLDDSLEGAIAVELGWWPQDDGSMIVASWMDSRGERGRVHLSAYAIDGIRKPDSIRSVRDVQSNALREQLARMLQESCESLPEWLRNAARTMHLWRAQERLHALWGRWIEERCDAAREAFELLDAWHLRDDHLDDYEDGMRAGALRRRKDRYRVLAADWARRYKTVLLPDRDLSREARFGEDADRRFTAAPQELRGALRNAFGADAIDVLWHGAHRVEESESEDAPDWLESAIEQWRDGKIAVRARKRKKSTDHLQKGGAWAARKARKAARGTNEIGAAREAARNDAE